MTRLFVVGFACFSLSAFAAELPSKADAAKYIKELSSKDPKVRAAACQSISLLPGTKGRLELPEAVEPLIDFLKKDSDPTNRTCAALALGRIKGAGPKAVPVVQDLLKNEQDRSMILAYLKCISMFREETPDFPSAMREQAITSAKEYNKRAKDRLRAAEEALAKAKESGDKLKIQKAEDQRNEAREIEQNAIIAQVAMVNTDH